MDLDSNSIDYFPSKATIKYNPSDKEYLDVFVGKTYNVVSAMEHEGLYLYVLDTLSPDKSVGHTAWPSICLKFGEDTSVQNRLEYYYNKLGIVSSEQSGKCSICGGDCDCDDDYDDEMGEGEYSFIDLFPLEDTDFASMIGQLPCACGDDATHVMIVHGVPHFICLNCLESLGDAILDAMS